MSRAKQIIGITISNVIEEPIEAYVLQTVVFAQPSVALSLKANSPIGEIPIMAVTTMTTIVPNIKAEKSASECHF
jgi:hypothetical protein